ncbi:MAG: ATP-dependent 6-phosphofructokinase [Verrucomicrobiales bacterium]|nr:ATP-dependent 6-phosphofructokinase [Verrucomicrobiales bacterium]
MSKHIGILTSGGDCPGLNAAIRGIAKAGIKNFDMKFLGFRNGFRGLVQDRTQNIDQEMLSGILTDGGTFLGTSRDKPHKMPVGGKNLDMTDTIIETYERHHLDALVCLGGGGTQKNALHLKKAGLNVVTLPKTIDNDVAMTDITFGFDTALGIATEAIDRVHSTATSHDRVIVVEIMGHRAGWLALESGIAAGADVILIPEIAYEIESVVEAIKDRKRAGKHFSIVAVAEGAMTREQATTIESLLEQKANASNKSEKSEISKQLSDFHDEHVAHTQYLTRELEKQTGCESRLTILGHIQRGGTPSPVDRVLATQLGTTCAKYLADGGHGDMMSIRGQEVVPVALEDVAGKKKLVPTDHPLVETARLLGTSLGE